MLIIVTIFGPITIIISVYVDYCENIRTYYNNRIGNMTHKLWLSVKLWNYVICSVFCYILNQN